MKIAIAGYGIQGESSYNYWNRDSNQITICDKNSSITVPEGVETQLGEAYLNNFDRFDLIVRTSFLHPKDIVDANGVAILDKVTSNTNEFFKVCPSKNIIGVTGTKGKGTTSTIIAKLLEACGQKVHLGGNIGLAPLDMLKENIQPSDWIVLELANVQLIDAKYSPHIGVCLMVVPEHLDWHVNEAEYYTSKQQLFRYQTPDDIAIYFANNDNSVRIAGVSQAHKIPFYEKPGSIVEDGGIKIDDKLICKTDELKLIGQHNWQNVCAAVTVLWQIDQNIDAMRSVLTTFSGLEHRLELIRELDGVSYYNDSFAAAPAATIAAVEAITAPKVMIVGGLDRGLSLTQLAETMQQHNNDLRNVIVIGASGPRLVEEFKNIGFGNYTPEPSKDITEIVNRARSLAQPGDAVVLSPGFASFDMFKNFEERGQQYKAAVNNL
jgi:UDP-N-acetylmuramoylalanine--D-glutamate ligase